MEKHLVLVGLNYQPQRSTGDKNFWLELIPLLAASLDRITVISVRQHPVPEETRQIGRCLLKIHYLGPRLLHAPDSGRAAAASQTSRSIRGLWQGGAFPAFWGLVEKLAGIRRIAELLTAIYAAHPFSRLHLLDNFGPGNRGLTRWAKARGIGVSVSAITYMGGRSRLLYHPYLRLCYRYPGLAVVPYSAAYKEQLGRLGVPVDRLYHIPWGVNLPEALPTEAARRQARQQAGFSQKQPLFLWAGLLQQIGESDFFYALDLARKALRKGLQAHFCFAFKPESLKSWYGKYHQPAAGIEIRATGITEFRQLQTAADVFFSPVFDTHSIIAPPLTWLEMLALGVPVATTAVRGRDAVIEEGRTGIAAGTDSELVNGLFRLAGSFSEMRENCLAKVSRDFNPEQIARQYLALWFKE